MAHWFTNNDYLNFSYVMNSLELGLPVIVVPGISCSIPYRYYLGTHIIDSSKNSLKHFLDPKAVYLIPELILTI